MYVCNVCIILYWFWCLTFVKTLQRLKINNHSVVGRRMETDGCRKGGGGEREERVRDFYSEAALAWQLAFVGSAVKADISLLGRVGYKISLPIRSRQIGAWWSVSKREVCLAFKGEKNGGTATAELLGSRLGGLVGCCAGRKWRMWLIWEGLCKCVSFVG